jgi:serine protease
VSIVASAGNSAGAPVGAPANCAGVIAVLALRHAGTKVGFSDLGPEITISAPGGNCVNIDAGEPCLYPILTATNAGTRPGVLHLDGRLQRQRGHQLFVATWWPGWRP